jgi:hypothetical protein
MQAKTQAEGFSKEQRAELEKFSTAAMELLFGESNGADNVVAALKSSKDVATDLAKFAYQITATLDEKSRGMMDPEMLPAVAADVLGQVAEAGIAAGVKIGGQEISMATRNMLMRFLSENGVDPAKADEMLAPPDDIAGQIDAHMARR